jgi:hypothetical protein
MHLRRLFERHEVSLRVERELRDHRVSFKPEQHAERLDKPAIVVNQ